MEARKPLTCADYEEPTEGDDFYFGGDAAAERFDMLLQSRQTEVEDVGKEG